MFKLSDQQKAVVNAPLEEACVIACAGSGKTKTAVYRLKNISEHLRGSRSHVALLSFSNVAVDTFRKAFFSGEQNIENNRVTIETLDGFITNNILRPHAYRTMKCDRVPFLLTGSENFLQNKKCTYWYESSSRKKIPITGYDITNIAVDIDNDDFNFIYRFGNNQYITNNGRQVTNYLASLGAYTHELGKYWSLRTLLDQPKVLKALANRYPYIIVDEAQDIGVIHQRILELLIEQGVKVTLIGDPNQAIYEFSGATGEFINSFNSNECVTSYRLSKNYRSIPHILSIANKIACSNDEANRAPISESCGAYYLAYDIDQPKKLVESFETKLENIGLSANNSAVLCRAQSGIEKLQSSSKSIGQGKVKMLAMAAIYRDGEADFNQAFKKVVNCIFGLLGDVPDNLASAVVDYSRHPEVRSIRQDIWVFIRDADHGLPSASLNGSTLWHTLMRKNVESLLDKIEQKYGYKKVNNLGSKLSKKALNETPLISEPDLIEKESFPIRVDTVHQAKGESLDAVLYLASKPHVEAMLNGTDTELGRIGYVAATRAKHLFILGIPKKDLSSLSPKIKKIGFKQL